MVNTSNSAAGRKILPNNQQPPLLSHGGSGLNTFAPPPLSSPAYAGSPSNIGSHMNSPSLNLGNPQGSLNNKGPPALKVSSQAYGFGTGNGVGDFPMLENERVNEGLLVVRKGISEAEKAEKASKVVADYEKIRKENKSQASQCPKWVCQAVLKKEREQKEKEAKMARLVQPIPPKSKGSKPKKDTSASKATISKSSPAQPTFGIPQISHPQKNSSQAGTAGRAGNPSAAAGNAPSSSSIPIATNHSSLPGTALQAGLSLPQKPEKLVKRQKLSQIVQDIDPRYTLAPEVEDVLLEIADDFIESVTTFACMLAKHRKSDVLEPKDITLHLERNWNIAIPGFFSEEMKGVSKRPTSTELHRIRSQQVKKALATSTAAELVAQKQKESK